ncbi:MAG: diphthine--ammonia ligase [Candidatus Omnitrophica bacterium]|nr:diphthine--ammonia ligase [Candidatus Omnitrophota bacterium]
MKVISLWSGGKDSCFAAYLARLKGHEIKALFNFTDSEAKGSLSHGLPSGIVRAQMGMTGFSYLQKAMPEKGYRREFKALIEEWKVKEGIDGIVFGDIYLEEHKDWIDEVCGELKVKSIMPLWGQNTMGLINEILKKGFRAVVVSVRADILGPEWLGVQVDDEFVKAVTARGDIDLCGEKGEYHTFVFDGPIFNKPVRFETGEKVLVDKHWFLRLEERITR